MATKESEKFHRENRYIVFKLSDVEKYLGKSGISRLAEFTNYIDYRRSTKNKDPLACVVVESDWPEYEPTWAAIEARMLRK